MWLQKHGFSQELLSLYPVLPVKTIKVSDDYDDDNYLDIDWNSYGGEPYCHDDVIANICMWHCEKYMKESMKSIHGNMSLGICEVADENKSTSHSVISPSCEYAPLLVTDKNNDTITEDLTLYVTIVILIMSVLWFHPNSIARCMSHFIIWCMYFRQH